MTRLRIRTHITLSCLFFLTVFSLAVSEPAKAASSARYPDLNTEPILPESALETVVQLPEPPGNIAVTPEGRIFFTAHPEGRPEGVKLFELKNGIPEPYPNADFQKNFTTPLGLAWSSGRLWLIDHGFNGFKKVRLFAFDLTSDKVTWTYEFPRWIAPRGSYLNDLRVSPDGRYAYIADINFVRGNPALVVVDTEKGKSWRVLESAESVTPGPWTLYNQGKKVAVLGGLLKVKLGVDGITVDNRDEWVYFAPSSQGYVYRILVSDLLNTIFSDNELSKKLERYAEKPLSDGIEIDNQDNLYITDVENGAVFRLDREKNLRTLVKSSRLHWPDGLSVSGGYLYITDSNLSEIFFRSRKKISGKAPFFIYRVKLPEN